MAEISIDELIEWFNDADIREQIPFSNSQFVEALNEAAEYKDESSLERLSVAMADSYIRRSPEHSSESMIREARETLATLAYLADHKPPSVIAFLAMDPVNAYNSPDKYGDVMNMLRNVYQRQGVDVVKDVFLDNLHNPQLN